jgi:hypothetical protein
LKDLGASAKEALSKRLPAGTAALETATSRGLTLASRDFDMANLETQVDKLAQLLSDDLVQSILGIPAEDYDALDGSQILAALHVKARAWK